ncbi:methionine ABC transporter ATP-binding protein [Sporolactobacillus terrae]|uniref:methionine ABC transporter ATP-binding protein n=1 Tax=Sporolactobacillus terrae TaxID=269673 RepID=UPI000490E05D|nr:ATP-binding cassette domain-containing protein [Sporolactobacillus terrae]
MIQLSNIEKTFRTARGPVQALTRVNLKVQEGEVFGIIGYSGAGKSTLIRLINLLEKPTSGTITIDGHDLTKLNERQLRKERRNIGMIFQHFNLLWSRTVAENIALPLELTNTKKDQRESRIAELIKMVGLEGKESAYPAQLSGGQKQRVGIARALANNPKVLLCDEATSALDPKTTDSILSLLSSINQSLGITILLITHEMSVIQKICSRVAVLDHGCIVEEGSVTEVFQHPKQQITKAFIGSSDDGRRQKAARLRDLAPKRATLVHLSADNPQLLQKNLARLLANTNLSVKVLGTERSDKDHQEKTLLAVEGTIHVMNDAFAAIRSEHAAIEVLNSNE